MLVRSFHSEVMSNGFARVLRGLSNVIYPPSCINCSGLTQNHGGLCPQCWNQLQPIEKPWCDVLGSPFAYDVGVGILSADAIANPPPFTKARSAVLYDDVARTMVHRLKYKDRTDLAQSMAGWMIRAGRELMPQVNAVLAVPLHRNRLMSRQYNQSAELSRVIAARCDLPHLPATLYRNKPTRRQVGLSNSARADNVKGAFKVPQNKRHNIAGKHLLLVDDVYTTGATVKSATRALLGAGADKVFVLTFARVAPGHL